MVPSSMQDFCPGPATMERRSIPLDRRKTRMDGNRLARKVGTLAALLLAAALSTLHGEEKSGDLAAARALFEKNLQAIRDQNRDAYLSCYLDSERLARTGPGGSELGYAGLAASAGKGWPDHIAADD